MKLYTAIILSVLFILVSGCMDQGSDSTDTKDSTYVLTDNDWDYYVFSYTSGKDLRDISDVGLAQINDALTWFDPTNESFLLQVNASNVDTLLLLKSLSMQMDDNISRYIASLQNFTLSNIIHNHSKEQNGLFHCYQNISKAFSLIFFKMNSSLNESSTSSFLVDVSDEMNTIFDEDEKRNDILNDQVNLLISIPEDVWDTWTSGRDWSFMQGVM